MRSRKAVVQHASSGSTGLGGAVHRQGLAERIKFARQRAGMTQRELAERLSVSAGAVGQWETSGVPATERLAALADALGVSLDWLLANSGQAGEPGGTGTEIEEDQRLVLEARRFGVDLKSIVAEARQQRWIEENRGALEDANSFIAKHGLWSDGKRLF